jgi:hypothetical protein
MAEYHFRRALGINSMSSVLRCYLSMALHAQNDDNKSFEALDVLIQACKVDPKNPQVREREGGRERGRQREGENSCSAVMYWYCCLPVSSRVVLSFLSSPFYLVLSCTFLSSPVLC